LFVGGAFANIGGGARAKIASLSTLTGGALAFNPNANNNINALAISGDTLFIGGLFTSIGGQTRNRVAAYRISTSGLLAIDPNANNTVNALAVKGNKLYIGGNFTSISNTAINSLAEFNVSTNTITSLNTGIANTTTVNALATADSSLYSGGGFSYPNSGQTIDNAAVVKTLSNRISFWMPQPDDIVRVIYLAPDKAYIGGKFKVIQSRYQPFFATTDLFNSGNPPTVASISSSTACVNETIMITGAGFTGVTSVSVGSNSVPFTVVSSTIITITPSVAVTGVVNVSNTLGNAAGNQTLTVNALPIASVTTNGSATFCQGSSVTLISNTGVGLTYQWKNNGTNISAATLSSYTATVAGNYAVTITNNNNCSATSNTINVTVNTTPTVAVSNATICSGNSANLAATGATTYNWNTGASTASISVTPNVTTNYTVTGTTNGCTNTKTVSVTVKSTPTVAVSNATICSGTSANIAATGATTYIWSTGATSPSISVTPIVNTNYTVTGTTNGCTNTKTVSVLVNSLPSLTVNSTTICPGATGTLTALGASTYTWNTGFVSSSLSDTPTANSTYTVTGTSLAGCINTATASIIIGNAPSISVNSATICSGNSANLTANGAATYSWSTGATSSSILVTPNTTTNYTVIGTDNGCTNTNTVSVTVNQSPIVNLGSIQSPLCVNNSSVPLSGTPLGGVFAGIGVSGSSFNPAISGAGTFTINYTYTDANNCSATASQSVNVSLCTGIIELDSDIISIFPNPASTEITITSPIKFTDVKIVNSIVQIVLETKEKNTVSVVELSSGVYFVQLFNENGNLLKVKKFIKE
jgi:hypothetical protein